MVSGGILLWHFQDLLSMLVLHDGMKDAVLREVLESKNRITLLGSEHISFTYLFLV